MRYNEEIDKKVNKMCPELRRQVAAPGLRPGSGRTRDTKLLLFRSEQTSFLSACREFPPLQLVFMSFLPLGTMIPTEAVTASHL